MNYRVTCLTPTLTGDGNRLAPIDYMVWKDQVHVLDQKRIFKLLSRGPRLEGYLSQLKKADKLDFASWGGFAQSYAERRIPFDHPSAAEQWQMEKAEQLFIPTFASGVRGPYLPGSALKGALRTCYTFSRVQESSIQQTLSRMEGDRPPRRPAEALEEAQVGRGGSDRMRAVGAADSAPVETSAFRIYMLRVATLQQQGSALRLGWKPNPTFAEMAAPGSSFTGIWSRDAFLAQPEVSQSLRWREPLKDTTLFKSANAYSAAILQQHAHYAEQAGMAVLSRSVAELQSRLAQAEQEGNSCVFPLGWGTGFFGKSVLTDTGNATVRDILRRLPYYERAIRSGLPFPKTRKVIFIGNQPGTLPGWVHLTIEGE